MKEIGILKKIKFKKEHTFLCPELGLESLVVWHVITQKQIVDV